MNEEKLKPLCCPFCGSPGKIVILASAPDGTFYIRCNECEADVAIRDVTGKITVKVEVKE